MKIYDTVLLGTGFASLGFAVARGNCLIIEERENCDNAFSLPLRGFEKSEHLPATAVAKALEKTLYDLGVIENGKMNPSALECGLCEHIVRSGVDVLIRTRVISVTHDGAIYHLRIINGGGISTVLARQILDTGATGTPISLTALFMTTSPASDLPIVKAMFPTATVAPAFYPDRYALTIPFADGDSPELVSERIYSTWTSVEHTATLMYVAPIATIAPNADAPAVSDWRFDDPVAACDVGASLAYEGGAL